MLPLVEIPELVRHYAPFFATVFSPDAFAHFQRYVSGLIVSENKTVDGINRLFVLDVRNQSSLNRWLTESPFSVDAVNQARLALLASLAGTELKPQGVLSIDDTLLTHYGQHFDKIAYLYDATQGVTYGPTIWSISTTVMIRPTIRSPFRSGSRQRSRGEKLGSSGPGSCSAQVNMFSKNRPPTSGAITCWAYGAGISTGLRSNRSITASY